jgi:hypothetical protein
MTPVTPSRLVSRVRAVALTSALAAGLALAGGILPAHAASPARALGPAGSLTPALAGPLAPPGGGTSRQHHRSRGDYGHTSAPDGRLRRGCHDYPYRYAVTPPTSDWTLETFLTDRTGDGVASDAYFSDSDPRRDRAHFRMCRYAVHAGRFTIRARLHWYSSDGTDHLVWLPRSHFRLHR